MARDYYDVLGVAQDAPESDIKKAYRKLAMQYHPDRNNGERDAEKRFKEATEAYETLRDPDKRAQYDRFGVAGVKGSAGGFGGFHPDLAEALSIFMRDFGGMGGFDAIFGGGQRERRARHRGQDVRMTFRVSLAEVVTGVTRKVKLRTLSRCEQCDGTGADGGATETCHTCGGVGEVRRATQSLLGRLVSVTPCPSCGGEGTLIRTPCGDCRGEGRVRTEKTVDIEVPPGVSSDNYLTLRGHGQAGPRGGPAGDLMVVIEVEDDPRFERHGNELVYDLPVSFSEAALGHAFEVPTPVDTMSVDVEPGTQSGTLLTVRGKGLPDLDSGRFGDLHVRVRVWTPTKLPREAKELLAQLSDMEGEPPTADRGGKGFWDKVKEAFGT